MYQGQRDHVLPQNYEIRYRLIMAGQNGNEKYYNLAFILLSKFIN